MSRWNSVPQKVNRRQCDPHALDTNALPRPIQNYLNQPQMNCLRRMELLDWRLLFVRREHCNPPLVVLRHKDSGALAVLDDQGRLNLNPRMSLRMQEA